MFPAAPLPSYPTTGLGATVIVQPTGWMALKACLFEGNPTLGSFGFDSAFVRGAGFMVASEVAATHHSQAALGDVGTTSVGAWRQQGDFPELTGVGARVFKSDFGFFIQNDERVLAHPANPEHAAGLNVITRFAWAQADRTNVDLYAGASVVWHGLGPRADDTVGAGAGGFRVRHPLGGTRGPGTELFFEAFYKWRLTRFLSLQPDVELYRHPGGDGSNAVVVGARLKVKL